MTATKKGFLRAGGVLAVIASVFLALMGFILVGATAIIDEDFIIDTYKTEDGFAYVEEAEGGYHIEYLEDEDDLLPKTVKDDEIQLIAKVSKIVLAVMAVFIGGLAIAQLIFAILILSKLSKEQSSKKLIITLLVLSILTGSMLTAAFMIVALCLKDKKPTLQNINEIAAEQPSVEQNNTEENKDGQEK